jgi:hypothetical protein
MSAVEGQPDDSVAEPHHLHCWSANPNENMQNKKYVQVDLGDNITMVLTVFTAAPSSDAVLKVSRRCSSTPRSHFLPRLRRCTFHSKGLIPHERLIGEEDVPVEASGGRSCCSSGPDSDHPKMKRSAQVFILDPVRSWCTPTSLPATVLEAGTGSVRSPRPHPCGRPHREVVSVELRRIMRRCQSHREVARVYPV